MPAPVIAAIGLAMGCAAAARPVVEVPSPRRFVIEGEISWSDGDTLGWPAPLVTVTLNRAGERALLATAVADDQGRYRLEFFASGGEDHLRFRRLALIEEVRRLQVSDEDSVMLASVCMYVVTQMDVWITRAGGTSVMARPFRDTLDAVIATSATGRRPICNEEQRTRWIAPAEQER